MIPFGDIVLSATSSDQPVGPSVPQNRSRSLGPSTPYKTGPSSQTLRPQVAKSKRSTSPLKYSIPSRVKRRVRHPASPKKARSNKVKTADPLWYRAAKAVFIMAMTYLSQCRRRNLPKLQKSAKESQVRKWPDHYGWFEFRKIKAVSLLLFS